VFKPRAVQADEFGFWAIKFGRCQDGVGTLRLVRNVEFRFIPCFSLVSMTIFSRLGEYTSLIAVSECISLLIGIESEELPDMV